MTATNKALPWAAIIIAAALMAAGLDLSSNASFGLVAGLTGAAWGSVSSGKTSCASSCLL